MGAHSRLGAANLALVSIYFTLVWGRDAMRALISPYHGLDDAGLQAAALWLLRPFNASADAVPLAAMALSAFKFIAAAAFLACAIEFARALLRGRREDRATADVALGLAVVGLALWMLPALSLADPNVARIHATQTLLVVGALVVIVVERHIAERSGAPAAALRPPAVHRALPNGVVVGRLNENSEAA